MQQKRDFFIDALHIFVLCNFAVAQPLFDLLSRNAEFFVTRHSEPVDIILLIIILCVLLPVLVLLIELVVSLFGRRARKGVHGFMVASLVAVIALPALKKIFELPGIALLVGAAILGVMATIVYIRFHPVRIFLTVLSPALLIFPSLFLFNSPVFKVVFPGKNPSPAVTINVENPYPIIMVVFDEFPVTSLMDEQRQIDPILYPNFASLAQDAYWFRNSTTVSGSTLQAIPAILTGLYPDQSRMATVADYPNNLFTLLNGLYRMKVSESHTALSPETLRRDMKGLVQRMYLMLSDLSAVYLHTLLPSDLSAGLPIVTQTWKHFWIQARGDKDHVPIMNNALDRAGASYKDRPKIFSEFVESITLSDKPTLYFSHFILPHVPWEYLPSGRVYTETAIPGLDIKKEQWGDDDWLVIQGYQRHLLQVGFVDKLMGDLLDKLRALNLYNESLIVITADHGVNFWSNKSRRGLLKEDPMGILGVPLFIKAPKQHEGIIIDRDVKTIDILPTIADILKINLPWQTDGRSAIQPNMKKGPYTARNDTLKRKLNLFSSGRKAGGLFKIGPHNDLVGRSINAIDMIEGSATVELDQGIHYANVDPDALCTNSHITGHLFLNGKTGTKFNLAIAVNGEIHAVTRTFPLGGGVAKWSAMVPETAFKPGKNDVEIFVVSRVAGQLRLERTRSRWNVTYSLAALSGQRGEIITFSDGTSIPVIKNTLKGHLDVADVADDHIVFSGWAADMKNSQLPEAIVVFVNGKFFYSGHCGVDRPDVVKAYDNAALQKAGFLYLIPLSLVKNITNSKVRMFAVSREGVASELIYPKGYIMSKKL
jgi:hypothetical protein